MSDFDDLVFVSSVLGVWGALEVGNCAVGSTLRFGEAVFVRVVTRLMIGHILVYMLKRHDTSLYL